MQGVVKVQNPQSEMCFVCYKIRRKRYVECVGVCKALIGYEGVNYVFDPCILCQAETPERYFKCENPCREKVQYASDRAQVSVNDVARTSAQAIAQNAVNDD